MVTTLQRTQTYVNSTAEPPNECLPRTLNPEMHFLLRRSVESGAEPDLA